MTQSPQALWMFILVLSATVCLAAALSYLARRGGLGDTRVALVVLTLATAGALLGLFGAAFEAQPEGAMLWHAGVRTCISFISAGGLGISYLLIRPTSRRVVFWVLVLGAVMGAGGVVLVFHTPPSEFVRTQVSWLPNSPAMRAFDTLVLGVASLAVTLGASWRLWSGQRYARWAMWLLVGKQLAFTTAYVLVRNLGSPDTFQTFIVLSIGPSTLVVLGALHNWRAAGVDASAFRLMFHALPLPAVAYDLHTEAVVLNGPAEKLLGPNPSAGEIAHQLGFAQSLRQVLHARTATEERSLSSAPGRRFELRFQLDPSRDIGLVLLHDVTERVAHAEALARTLAELRAAQEKLVQNEKMVALGVVVAGVNHEINNPLAYVAANLRAVTDSVRALLEGVPLARKLEPESSPGVAPLRRWAESEEVHHAESDALEALSEASDGTQRIRDLVSSMRLFSRQEEAAHEVDLTEIARAGLTIGRTNFPPGIEVAAELGSPLKVRGAAGELTRAVTNLVANAGQAMGGRGRLTVRTCQEGAQAVVEVADDGPGVPENLRHRIFDPFFTTKEPGQGTGLGLAISFETARRHQGELVLVDRPVGACFQLRLPLSGVPSLERREEGSAALPTQ